MGLKILTGIWDVLTKTFAFVIWFVPWLWRVIKASRLGVVLIGILDIVKSIGVTRILAYFFVLGFLFKALLKYAQDGDLTLAVVSIARVFVAAEEQAVEYTNQLIGEPQAFWFVIWLYLMIFGSFLVFYYMYRFVSWVFRFFMSDSSKKGIGPVLIVVFIIFMFEFVFLMMDTLSVNNGDLSTLTFDNVFPFKGFRYFIANFGNLPGIGLAVDTTVITNTTIENLTSTADVDKPRGMVSSIICSILPIC